MMRGREGMGRRGTGRGVAGALAGLALLLGAAAPAFAQPAAPAAATPQLTTASYQDWLVRCETPEGKAKVCEIVQAYQAQNGQGTIAQIVLGRPSKSDPMKLIVELPPGVRLPAGVTVQASEKAAPIALVYQSCPRSCFAEAELKPEQLQALRAAGEQGILTFEDGSRQKVQLPISFKGFVPALDASQKG